MSCLSFSWNGCQKGRCWKEESLKSQAEGGSNFFSFVTLKIGQMNFSHCKTSFSFFLLSEHEPTEPTEPTQRLVPNFTAKTKIAARGVKLGLRGQSSRFQPSTASSWTSKTYQSGGGLGRVASSLALKIII